MDAKHLTTCQEGKRAGERTAFSTDCLSLQERLFCCGNLWGTSAVTSYEQLYVVHASAVTKKLTNATRDLGSQSRKHGGTRVCICRATAKCQTPPPSQIQVFLSYSQQEPLRPHSFLTAEGQQYAGRKRRTKNQKGLPEVEKR